MMRTSGLLVLLFSFFPHLGITQIVQGTVLDGTTNKPLRGATVSISETTLKVDSDVRGNFTLEGLEEGVNTIRISHPEFEHVIKEVVHVATDTVHELKVCMRPTVRLLHKDVVITASRHEREPFHTPEAISVYDQQQFRQLAPSSMSYLLADMPAVWIEQHTPGQASMSLRGISGNRNLIMIDGIRLNHTGIGGGRNSLLNMIDPFSMERLEVIRGSGSVQYGSDAMGGVAHVFTKSPSFSNQGLKVHANSFFRYMSRGMENSGRGELQLSGSHVALHGGYTRRKFGDLYISDGRPLDPSSYQEESGDFKAAFRLSNRHMLTMAYQFVNQENIPFFPELVTGRYERNLFDPQQRRLGYARMTSFYENPWFKEVKITGSFQRISEGRSFQQSKDAQLHTQKDEIETWGGTVEIHSRPNLYWNIVSGVELYQDQVFSEAYSQEISSTERIPTRPHLLDGSLAGSMGIYSLHTLDIVKLRLSFGGRANAFLLKGNDPAFGQQQLKPQALVGNISALYPLTQKVHITSSFNTGFRSPNIYDISTFGPSEFRFEVPADSLLAERSFTSQIGVKANTDHFTGSLVFYRTQLTDLIDQIPSSFLGNNFYDGLPVYEKVNISQAFLQGFEAALEVPVSSAFALYGSLVYTYGENLTREEPLSKTPPLNSRLGLRFRTKIGVWSRLEWVRAGTQDRLSSADIVDPYINPEGTPSWNVFNIHLGYNFKWGYATIGIRNVLDESYRLHGSAIDGRGRVVLLSSAVGILN